MSEQIYKFEQTKAAQVYEFVQIQFKRSNGLIHYRPCFDLCHAIRLGAKQAMQFDRTAHQEWRAMAEMIDEEMLPDIKRSSQFRVSGMTPTIKNWRIDATSSALVVIIFDGVSFPMHYAEALKFQAFVRHTARAAKAWAGDDDRHRGIRGNLTDAEKNYARPIII